MLRDPITQNGAKTFNTTPQNFSSWHWQMKHQAETAAQISPLIHLSKEELTALENSHKLFRPGITPYYLQLIRELPPQDQIPLRLQALPHSSEHHDPHGHQDPLNEVQNSPVKEVVHVYPDRVAFCVAQLCPLYCRYCYRKRRDDEVGLHFNRNIITTGIDYIKATPSIRDVLITGGDPLIANDASLDHLLAKIRQIPHVEIIRIGTRTPVTLPYRITPKLAEILRKYQPLWLSTHFNCAAEISSTASIALDMLSDHGIPINNQSVLLKGVNDSSSAMLALCRKLVRHRVRPYYLFHAHMVSGTAHLRVSVNRGLAIMKDLRGHLSGYAIPNYILDTPSGKVPLSPHRILATEGKDLIVEDLNNQPWKELDAIDGPLYPSINKPAKMQAISKL